MEEDSTARRGRRRRGPRKESVGDQTCSPERQNILYVDNNSATQQALDGSIKTEQTRRKRTRKPKKVLDASNNNDEHAAAPPTGSNDTNQLEPSSFQAPTWQQEQSFLNAEAPDFQPRFPASSAPVEDGGTTAAKAKPRRQRKKKNPPAPQNNVVTNTAEETELPEHDEEIEGEAPLCLLCCSPMKLVSFGSCGHVTACGACCLRLRMCYKRTECSVCKSELPDVVIAPWRPDLPEFSFYLDHPEVVARSRPGKIGPGCILADKWQPKNRRPSSKLLHDLERSTGIACSVCDKTGSRPFPNYKELSGHLSERHKKFMCGICFREGRTFPLDLPLYDSKNAVKEHTAAVHPRCDFCRGRTFFDGDALWTHMMETHHRCHLCEPGPGGSDSWFADAENLRAHLSADHFACDDGDCAACLVAFRTADELRRHHIERHSARMPRWNPAAARPMQLDIQFVRRPAGISAEFTTSTSSGISGREAGVGSGAGEGRASRNSRGRQRRGGRHAGGAGGGDDLTQQQQNNNNRFQRQTEFEHETDGGIRIIDDDLGMLFEADDRFGGGGGSGYRNSLGFGGYSAGMSNWGTRSNSNRAVEAFPSLATAAAEAVADSSATNATTGATRRPPPPPLVKHTVRCPCGRRVTYPVIEEGQSVPSIECDAVCRLEGRKKTLADAFGVEDPDRHISCFERRPAVWSGMLLDAAKRNPTWVESIEKEFASFIANRDSRRHALPAMTKAQRAVVYGMAEQYGLASAAMGVEPRRYIELFKTGDTAGLPSKVLSKMALTVSEEEISAMLEAAAAFPIRFIEIAPTADLYYYLRRWEPRFRVEWQGGSQATVTFEKEEEMKEALDAFGGGIRGIFRIDRSWHPRTGMSTAEASSRETHVAPWAEGSAAAGSGAGGAAGSAQWRSVATAVAGSSGGAASGINHGDGKDNTGSGSSTAAVPSGWAVIGGKKAVKPRVMAAVAAAAAHGGEVPRAQFSALSLAEGDNLN